MKTELLYLTYVAGFTGLLWIPYIVDRMLVWGLPPTVGYPDNPRPQSPWARRLQKAHLNAVENLVVFATLILAAHALNISTAVTAQAAVIYFWARVAHAVVYTLAIPWLRTLAFTVGFLAQAAVAWQILVS